MLFGLQPDLDQKPTNLTAKTFFVFWSSPIFRPKRVTPRNAAPGATIPSNASASYRLLAVQKEI